MNLKKRIERYGKAFILRGINLVGISKRGLKVLNAPMNICIMLIRISKRGLKEDLVVSLLDAKRPKNLKKRIESLRYQPKQQWDDEVDESQKED